MAFHLSTVVSPICQSSSPEGLIPMDADLGKLLQLIQEEAQCNTLTLLVSGKPSVLTAALINPAH